MDTHMQQTDPRREYRHRGPRPGESPVSLIVGFCLAILLTLLAYKVVMDHIVAGWPLTFLILFFAFVQLIVQLIYFLHLREESKSHWKLILISFTAFIVCILVAGSLWIMGNLNSRMTPQQMDDYMNNQQSF